MESKKIKKGDFIELDYTGKFKDDGIIFDTTSREIAEANDLNKEANYKPVIICLGEGMMIPALEAALEGKTIGKNSFDLTPEMAFGKKSAKLLKLVPMKVFKQQDIMPYPGLEVNIDGTFGIIRNVSGGRVIVDFNHPLSGKDLSYDVNVKKIVTNDKEKVETMLQASRIHFDSVSVKEKNAMVVLEHDEPAEAKKFFEEKTNELVGIKKFNYVVKKAK